MVSMNGFMSLICKLDLLEPPYTLEHYRDVLLFNTDRGGHADL